MKKSIIIVSTVAGCIALSAFSFIKWQDNEAPLKTEKQEKEKVQSCSQPISSCGKLEEIIELDNILNVVDEKIDFHYGIGSRFGAYRKSDIDKAESFTDFMDSEEMEFITEVNSIKVIIIVDDKQTDLRKFTKGNKLSKAQKDLLRNSDYSTNFLVSADCIRKNHYSGELEQSQYRPHLTIVPDYQAEYKGGFETLISYFKENSTEERKGIESKKLTPAKIYFTITKDGEITNVKLDRTTGYSNIDKKMVQLVTDMPNKWSCARNDRGESLDQELVFTFGVPGC